MGRRLTRKEIKKKDPITESLEQMWTYYQDNKRLILMALTVVLAVVVVVMVGRMLYTRSVNSRAISIHNAMKIYDAQVDPKQTTPKEGVYKSETDKYKAALAEFEKLADEYGSSHTGQIATYYKGICLRTLGKLADSETTLKGVLDETDDSEFRQVVQMALAETYRDQAKYKEADTIYDELLKSEHLLLPRETVVYAKSINVAESGNVPAAIKLLQRAYDDIQAKKKEDAQYYTPLEKSIKDRLDLLKAKASLSASQAS